MGLSPEKETRCFVGRGRTAGGTDISRLLTDGRRSAADDLLEVLGFDGSGTRRLDDGLKVSTDRKESIPLRELGPTDA